MAPETDRRCQINELQSVILCQPCLLCASSLAQMKRGRRAASKEPKGDEAGGNSETEQRTVAKGIEIWYSHLHELTPRQLRTEGMDSTDRFVGWN